VKIPVYAIGGINKGNARSVVDAGADAICVISAVVSQKDPVEAARSLREIIA
jgi:thiamine monophosphate synthase